ncbi:MAG: DUF1992 domain-containing protein [Desulfovibrionaceae bacterium]|nr:DUF1992 domain-containing protein [Desulfovibrionaceae bacterium]
MQEFPFSAIQYIAEKRIAEAMDKGEFDNLPGRGKPLEIEDLSAVPEDLRMAYKILKNAGCLTPELEERKTITSTLELLEGLTDERERLCGMQKLRLLIERSRARYKRDIRLEQDDPYYADVIARLTRIAERK